MTGIVVVVVAVVVGGMAVAGFGRFASVCVGSTVSGPMVVGGRRSRLGCYVSVFFRLVRQRQRLNNTR